MPTIHIETSDAPKPSHAEHQHVCTHYFEVYELRTATATAVPILTTVNYQYRCIIHTRSKYVNVRDGSLSFRNRRWCDPEDPRRCSGLKYRCRGARGCAVLNLKISA